MIVLTTYNRPGALARTLKSLSATDLSFLPPELRVHLVVDDDVSTDPATVGILSELRDACFLGPSWWCQVLGEVDGHSGPNDRRRRSLWRVFEMLPECVGVPFVITIESDVVYHPGWLACLLSLYDRCSRPADGPLVLDGVGLATLSPYRSRAYSGGEVSLGGWCHRPKTGGVCHLIPRWWYDEGKKPNGWMTWQRMHWAMLPQARRPTPVIDTPVWAPFSGGWDYCMSDQARREGLRFGCLVPSRVDHVSGPEGGTSGSKLAGDRALDFVAT